MPITDIHNHVYLDEGIILYSKTNARLDPELTINYKIEKEEKLIRLYNVPRFLTYQEKEYIYYILLENYYFYPLGKYSEYEDFENYIVKENGYSFYEYNSKDESKGILGELLIDIPRPEREPEKIARIRDIYNMLIRNYKEIGDRPICIAFNGTINDFKSVYRVLQFLLDNDTKLKAIKKDIYVFKRIGIFGGNKRIYIVPKKVIRQMREKENTDKE